MFDKVLSFFFFALVAVLIADVERVRKIVTEYTILSLVVSNLFSLFYAFALYSQTRGGVIKMFKKRVFVLIFTAVSSAPVTKGIVSGEIEKVSKKLQHSLTKDFEGQPRNTSLPEKGWTAEQILDQLRKWKEYDEKKWNNGKISGAIYQSNEKVLKLAAEAQGMFILSNPLHPEIFPAVRKMEAEVVRMCVSLFNGTEKACGTLTSGGTESIIMAIRAAKIYAINHRGINEDWEIILPVTAHPAFEKGSDYFGIRIIRAEVDPITRRVIVENVQKLITNKTILIVGSAPNYPNGGIDPIEDLAQLAKSKKVLLHVDCCLGSFLVAFAKRLRKNIPNFDFSIDGVTSISCDTHKYGYSPKGTSVIMYSTPELRQCQYFVSPEWCGGVYASPTMAGSRPGSVSVSTWAVLMNFGINGYTKSAEKILEAAEYVEKNVSKEIPELKVLGTRHLSVVCLQTRSESSINIYSISDLMKTKGWNLNSLQYPASLHICFTDANADSAKLLLSDLKESVEEIKAHPDQHKGGSAAIYGLAESLPDKTLIGDVAVGFVNSLFYT